MTRLKVVSTWHPAPSVKVNVRSPVAGTSTAVLTLTPAVEPFWKGETLKTGSAPALLQTNDKGWPLVDPCTMPASTFTDSPTQISAGTLVLSGLSTGFPTTSNVNVQVSVHTAPPKSEMASSSKTVPSPA